MKRVAALFSASLLVATGVAQTGATGLLVTSRHSDEVLLYDAAGRFVRSFANGGGLDNPVGLTFGPDGHLYVASANNDLVLRYDGATGAFLSVFARGGGLTGARNLNFGPDGDLYVCSGSTGQVVRYDGRTGAPLGVFAQHTAIRGNTSLTFGPDGDLFVGSVFNSQVVRFDGRTGAFVSVFATAGIQGAHDLSFGPEGDLYVSNAFAAPSQVVRFDGRTGQPKGGFVSDPALQFPLGMSWDHNGDLYVANQGNHDVRRYDGRTGRLLSVFVPSRSGGLNGPLFLAFVHDASGPRAHAPFPLGVGVPATFLATGGRPGGLFVLGIGTTAGSLPLPCPGLSLGMTDPIVLGYASADEGGRIARTLHVPTSIAGVSVLLQAVDLTGCAVSPVLRHRF